MSKWIWIKFLKLKFSSFMIMIHLSYRFFNHSLTYTHFYSWANAKSCLPKSFRLLCPSTFAVLKLSQYLPVRRAIMVCISQTMIWIFYTRSPNPKNRLFSILPNCLNPVLWSPKPRELRKAWLLLEWWSWKL